jgi:Rrf2 family protein
LQQKFLNQEEAMFSSLTRNAINTLLWVCKNQGHGPVTTDSISKRLGLSTCYLESLLSKLKKLGFLVSYLGPGGGYCSNGKPDSLRLIDLVQELDFNPSHKTQTCNSDLCAIDKDLVNWLGAGHYSICKWLVQRGCFGSLDILLTAGTDPVLAVIDFDSNSSSTRLTASRRS